MKKTIAKITAAILLLSPLSACGLIREQTGATLEVDLKNCWITEQIDYSSKTLYPECSTDNGVLLTYTDNSKDRQQHAIFWDAATETFSEKELHSAGKKHGSGRIFPLADGKIGMVFQNTGRGIRDWEFEDQDTYIDIYSSDMTYEKTVPFSRDTNGEYVYNFSYTESNGTPYYTYVYQPNGFVWVDENAEEDYSEIMVLDEQMQFVDAIHVPSSRATIFQGASKDIYVQIPLNAFDNTYTYSRVDLENMQLQPVTLEVDSRYIGRGILCGTNGYEFYTVGPYGLCGITFNGTQAESELLIDFPNSNFLAEDYLTVAPTPDGKFIIRDSSTETQNLWLVRERTEEEMKNVKVISMAGVGFNTQLQEVVNRFNRTHSDYRIMMVDYMQFIEKANDEESDDLRYYGEDNPKDIAAASELFMQDLLNGTAPDIICTDNLPFEQLANKGLFQDMTKLMEKDDRFREEDYVMSFFDAMKYKGEQQTIAFSFYLNTVAGKAEFVGDQQGLTAEAFLEMLDSRPDTMRTFTEMRQENYKENFLPWVQNSFLDTENATCSFDSPAFVKILEIGNELPIEWEDMEYDPDEIINNKSMLTFTSFNQPIDYRKLFVTEFNYADMTLVGYPSMDDGNGCIFSAPYTVGINAMSKYQDIIWDIFMELLGEGTQRYLDIKRETYSFPVLRSALEEDLEASAKGALRMDGKITIGKNSEADVAFLKDYIEHTTMFYYSDPTITNIIKEEADMYYAGDQTAEEAAKMIQSRASIYLSEQY